VNGGLETTFAVLANSKNAAADSLLTNSLDAADRDVRLGALRALLARRSMAGQRELLRRWRTLSNDWKTVVADNPLRFVRVVREAILSNDKELCLCGCDAALWIQDFYLIPVLITAAEDRTNPQAELASETLLKLCESLYEELAAPRDYRKRRDPQVVRRNVVSDLEQSVQRFGQHKRIEIAEAFLLLANRENAVLKQVLQNPHDKCYLTIVNLLTHCPRPGVMRLLISFLEDTHLPPPIQGILSRRRDIPFVRNFLKKTGEHLNAAVRANLKRFESFTWLRDDLEILADFDEGEQQGAVQLAMACKMNRLQVFSVVKYVTKNGAVGGRRAAVASLSQFSGAEANELLVEALHDSDPEIQAMAVTQIQDRRTPGAMAALVDLIDSPHEMVRRAVRTSLKEIRFKRYLETFAMLDAETRESVGQLVRRVDPHAIADLIEQLTSSSRSHRLRAVEMAVAMGALKDVKQELRELLADENHFVQDAARRALAQMNPRRKEHSGGMPPEASQTATTQSATPPLGPPAEGPSTAPIRPDSGGNPWGPNLDEMEPV
jgi:hypothetical protein